MYEITSIGDGAYLTAVLNAVAMLSGSGDLQQLAGVGFLIGVLLVMFQAILQARASQLQNLLVAWVVYAGMFGPAVRVSVEDLYSGAVRTVDHVPLGVAFVGSAMSQVGYGATRLFEQAFATPAMTEYGFAAPLQILQSVRKGTLSKAALGAANSPTPGADVERSWVNYIAECALYAVDIGRRSIEEVLRDPSWQSAFATDLNVPTTELRLGANPVVEACDEAWADLQAYTAVQFVPALRRSLAATLSVNVSEVDTRVQDALDAVAGAGVDAMNYMVMAAAVGFLKKGEAQVHQEIGDWAYAAMVEQAVQQRNTQWAAEETLFARIVRPMMTFFEAFLFAVSPLMAFAIGLGPVGIRMVGKYLLFGLWIQLWQPILAIVNLYILMAIHGKLDALQAAGAGDLTLPSAYAVWKLDLLLSDYLGVGGMLASSAPAISLMLIYGSAITATHLAGRLQGGDHINEKVASPDVASPAPALLMGPLKSHQPLTGTATPNADSVLWTADIGRSMQTSVRSSEQALEQASRRFSSTLASTATASASRDGQTFDARAMGWDYAATGSATDRTIAQEAEDLTKRYQQAGLSQHQMAAVLAGAAGAAGELGGGVAARAELQGRIAGELNSQYGVGDSLSDTMASEIAAKVATDKAFESRLAESIRADTEAGRRNVFSERLSADESSTLQRDAADVVSASRTLEREQSMARRYDGLGSYGAAEIGHAIANDPAMMDRLHREIDRRNLTGDHDRLRSQWNYAASLTPQAADAAAGIALLIGHADGETLRKLKPAEAQDAREAGYGILADTFSTHRPGMDPYRNTDLEARAPAYGGSRSAFEGAAPDDPRAQTAGLRQEIGWHGTTVDRQFDPGAADRFRHAGRGSVEDLYGAEQARIRAQKRERLGALIDQRAILPTPAAQALHNELGGLAIQLAESGALLRAGLGGVADQTGAAVKSFGDTLLGGGGLSQALEAGKTAAGGEAGWSKARETLIEARMQQIVGYGLTPAQQHLFRESTESLLAALPSPGKRVTRQAVIDEVGTERGAHIADLIERAASSRDDTDLRLIGNYAALASPEKKSPDGQPLGALDAAAPTSAIAGASGRVLDLIAQPESDGNYNAWYGNPGQSQVDLSRLTVGQIRDLQRDLVQRTGGSAIGRYQILGTTLDNLASRMNFAGNERFTPALQDRMGLLLARDAGLDAWASGRLSDERFAANLAQIWAGLPADASNRSAHEGVAGNRANVSWAYVQAELARIRASG